MRAYVFAEPSFLYTGEENFEKISLLPFEVRHIDNDNMIQLHRKCSWKISSQKYHLEICHTIKILLKPIKTFA